MSRAVSVGLCGLLVGGPGVAVVAVAFVLPLLAVYAYVAQPGV